MATEVFKTYYCILTTIIIVILFSLRQCSEPEYKTEENIITQTSYDTIKSKDTLIQFKEHWYPKVTTITKIEYKVDSNLCKYTREYSDSLSDSNLTIFTNNKVLGQLQSSKTSYRLKIPIKIIETNNITKEIIQPNKFDLFALSEIGGNKTEFNASLGLGFRYKKELIELKYNFIDKTYNVGIGLKIWSSRK